MLSQKEGKVIKMGLASPQAAQAHVSRKSHRLVHESVMRCVIRCYVTRGAVENLNTLYGIVWGTKYGRFTTINISKYEHFTRKINKTYLHPVVNEPGQEDLTNIKTKAMLSPPKKS